MNDENNKAIQQQTEKGGAVVPQAVLRKFTFEPLKAALYKRPR